VLPDCVAVIVQVPYAISVIVVPHDPLEVQTNGVALRKRTVYPDDAVALTEKGDWTSIRLLNLANVIV
jgi:hypothetical protein